MIVERVHGAPARVWDFRRPHFWRWLSKLARFFPAIVTGSVITTIGLTLIYSGRYRKYGWQCPKSATGSWLLSLVTVAIILVINIFTKASLNPNFYLNRISDWDNSCSIMGLVDFAPVVQSAFCVYRFAAIFGVPTFVPNSLQFS